MLFGDDPVAGANPMPGMFELNEEYMRRLNKQEKQWFLRVGTNAVPVCAAEEDC